VDIVERITGPGGTAFGPPSDGTGRVDQNQHPDETEQDVSHDPPSVESTLDTRVAATQPAHQIITNIRFRPTGHGSTGFHSIHLIHTTFAS